MKEKSKSVIGGDKKMALVPTPILSWEGRSLQTVPGQVLEEYTLWRGCAGVRSKRKVGRVKKLDRGHELSQRD